MEHLRNYSYSQHPNDQKDEFILKLDPKSNKAEYLAIATKLAVIKKKKVMYVSQEDEERLEAIKRQLTPHFMTIAPRSQTATEAQKCVKSFKESTNLKVSIDD